MALFLSFSIHADIYKCERNGTVQFQDKPCETHSEKLNLSITKPSSEAVNKQKALTEKFKSSSRVNQIEQLKQQNSQLSDQLISIQKDYETEYKLLTRKGYDLGNGKMATRDSLLLEKMKALSINTEKKRRTLEQKIQQNSHQIEKLKSQQ